MEKGFIIAIDGPAAAGKSTVSSLLAKKLNGYYLYTGAMYRSLALYCIENNIDIFNERAVENILQRINLDFNSDGVYLNGKNITQRIKKRDVDQATPIISDYQSIRHTMKNMQREIAKKKTSKGHIVVADGRDMATVVFPNAKVKIYLTANTNIRAERRLKQFRKLGQNLRLQDVLSETKRRDEQDMHGKLHYLVDSQKTMVILLPTIPQKIKTKLLQTFCKF